jgi:hypothetical protein
MIPRNSWLPMTKRHIYLWFGCRGICDDFVEVTEAGGHRQIFFVLDAEAQRAIPVATLEVKKSEKVVLIVKHYSRTTLTVCQRIIIISFVAPS